MSKCLAFLLSAALPLHPVFTHITTEDGLSQNSVFSIAQDSDHNMWFATMDAVDRYDGYRFRSYSFDPEEFLRARDGASPQVFIDAEGRVCVNAGVIYRYDKSVDGFEPLDGDGSRRAIDSLKRINEVRDSILSGRWEGGPVGVVADMAEACGRYWFATTQAGVVSVPVSGGGEAVQWTTHTAGRVICSNNVRSVCHDGAGHVWAGTGNGLSVIDAEDFSVVNLRQSPEYPDGPGNNMIKDIFLDDAAGIWVASYYGGIDYCHARPLEFSRVGAVPAGEVIGDIAGDRDGRLWVGTGRSGIFRLSDDMRTVDRPGLSGSNPEYDDVKAIVFSRDGRRVYVGTGLGGLTVLDYRTDAVISHSGGSAPGDVYSILEEDDRWLWLGSLSGLYLYDTQTGSATAVDVPLGRHPAIFSLVRNPRDSSVLLGTSGPLVSCTLSAEGGQAHISNAREYDGISLVQDILPVGDDIWVASRKGLFVVHESGVIDEISGLQCKLVRGLELDADGKVWAGTENGLCSITPDGARVSRYCKSDGLVTDSFSLYAHMLSSDGTMYFGGVGGLVSFNPQDEMTDGLSRRPRVSSVIVDGEELRDWENGIVLSSDKKVIDLYFSVPNYSSAGRSVFSYRLKGASDAWNVAGPSSQVSFSSLTPGRYTFELSSENAYGVPCEDIYSFKIRVRPPWYFSPVAIAFYFIAFCFCACFVTVRRVRRISSDKDRQIRKLTVRQFTGKVLSAADEAFLMKVLQIVGDNLGDESFNVEKLASMLCMSRGNLHIKIKKITGESAIRLIQKLRFDRACELLKDTDLPVSEIGAMVGFSSPAYFTASFKRHVGVLPGRYRG